MAITDFLGEIAAIGGAICFGLGNVLIKSQGDKIKPMAINAIRLSFSAIFYFILICATGDLRTTFQLNSRTGLFLFIGSLLGIIIGDVIFYFSQQLIGLSRAYPIAVSYPLLTYIVGIIAGYEIYDPLKIQGVFLVIFGVYLVSISTSNPMNRLIRNNVNFVEKKTIDEDLLVQEEFSKEEKKKRQRIILGTLGAMTTAICWTIGTILLDRGLVVSDISGISANAFRVITISPVALIIFLASNNGKLKSTFTWKGFLIVLLAGIIGNTAGTSLYLFSLSFTEASTTAAITAASPLIATPLSVLFLKERISLLLIFGTLFTLTGIWLIIL